MQLTRCSSSLAVILTSSVLAACSSGTGKGAAGAAGAAGMISGASGRGHGDQSGGGAGGGGGKTRARPRGWAATQERVERRCGRHEWRRGRRARGAAGGGAGAAGGDAGAIDGGAGASGADGGAADAGSNPCATAIFCDDFESYTAGAAPKGHWKVTTNQGTVSVDGTHAHSGKNAVHALTTGAQAYESAYIGLEGAPVFPVPGNGFFGRMMMYATQAPTDVVHWTIIQGEGPVPGQNITNAVYRYGGQYNQRFMANYDSGPAKSDCWHHSQTTIPLNKWACVEWQFDGPASTLRFWLDGQPIDDLTVVGKGDGCIAHDTMDNWYAPTFSALRLGWEHYQQGPGELWIDDVVVDGKRIGCPAP